MTVECVILVQWRCPVCGLLNHDDFAATVEPLCETCNDTIGWEFVFKPGQYSQVNELLANSQSGVINTTDVPMTEEL